MIVFKWLRNWFDDKKSIFSEKKIEYTFSKLNENTNKPFQNVDIYTEIKMARISLWETGECDFEVIENYAGKQVYWENRVIKTENDLSDFLNEGFSKL